MSYDIELKINTGGTETHTVYEDNYTYNVAPMFRAAMLNGLYGIQNKQASEAIPILTTGINNMEAEPDRYRAMNPSNGWGSYEGALEVLVKLREACQNNPLCTIKIS